MLVRATLKWIAILAALLAVGPVAGMLVGRLHGPGGIESATPLLAQPLSAGLAAAGASLALAAAMGLAAARFFGSRTGMTCAGLVLAWAAWSTGSIDALLAPARAPGEARAIMIRLAVEGAALGLACLALAAGILRAGAAVDALILQKKHRVESSAVDLPTIATATFAALALGGLAAWWIAFQPIKGQTVFGAIAGAVAAAAAAHLTAPHLPARASALAAFIALGLLALAGPLTPLFLAAASLSARAAAAGSMSHLAFPSGLDWAAGAFLGVPIGLGWSGSMVEKHTAPAPGRAAA